nr:hypothetical protein CFP56_76574 [Quercus suber]
MLEVMPASGDDVVCRKTDSVKPICNTTYMPKFQYIPTALASRGGEEKEDRLAESQMMVRRGGQEHSRAQHVANLFGEAYIGWSQSTAYSRAKVMRDDTNACKIFVKAAVIIEQV